ncbi:hypothetical protein BU006_03695 [Mammaliicoccus sciuri]|nr:hypothetical protein BU006_03695 [Mammaliicoccus sciuri]
MQVRRDKQSWEAEYCKWDVTSKVGRLNIASEARQAMLRLCIYQDSPNKINRRSVFIKTHQTR